MATTLVLETARCLVCGKTGRIEVSADDYFTWRGGAFIQDAFPELSAPVREQILTGTHPECWDTMVGVEE